MAACSGSWGAKASHLLGKKEVIRRWDKGKRQAKSRKEWGTGKVLLVKHTLISKVTGLWCCPKQKTYMVCKIYSISSGKSPHAPGFSLRRWRFILSLMFNVPDCKSLIRDKDIFLPSDSSNTPNFYSSNQVRFSRNKAAGDDPNCGVITVILTR